MSFSMHGYVNQKTIETEKSREKNGRTKKEDTVTPPDTLRGIGNVTEDYIRRTGDA